MNIPKEWIEKRARAEAGDCTTIGAMPSLNTTVDDWITACKVSNPEASEETVREWYRKYQETGGGFDLPNGRDEPMRSPDAPPAGRG